ncbi:YeaH/YhbH family protein [Clostridium oryzae]|uniref:UPF0229 protein CLORY_11480 n=1 Tax=Clostridium oryzae TaxID=1450648 RepID=A0A1V4ITV5_9CLOT|nr:YeaH/YhbH family protein [Clostridium oryzae]OPJ63366.1 hypothetical protein CLORY_11480 [Clostridium oryzae]
MAIFRDITATPVDHDRSVEDRRRHRQLVEKSIKENIGEILSEESIVGESNNKKFKIPIRSIKEYQFIYGKNVKGNGSGTGEEKRGQKIGEDGDENAKGFGGAGNEAGEEIYETEITLEELMDYIMDDLELPYIQKKKYSEILCENSNRRRGYQKFGINPRLAKKRTVMSKIARKQSLKRALREEHRDDNIERVAFRQEDLKYYKIKPKIKRESNAAIILVMDVSGSMDNTKKYLARSYFYILSKFIRKKYNNVKVAFIAHTTVANEVNEYEFFHRTESGGTYISSGLNKALEVITRDYSPDIWNVYTFCATDGDNWSDDNDRTIEASRKLCDICNLFGYIELLPSAYSGSMMSIMNKELSYKNFVSVAIKDKTELWNAFKVILGKEMREGDSNNGLFN